MNKFTIPTCDKTIDNLIGQLSILVKKFGKNSPEVQNLLQKHGETTYVDPQSGFMHTFEEVAIGLVYLFEGITITNEMTEETWKSGNSEDIFYQKESSDPADWWK